MRMLIVIFEYNKILTFTHTHIFFLLLFLSTFPGFSFSRKNFFIQKETNPIKKRKKKKKKLIRVFCVKIHITLNE